MRSNQEPFLYMGSNSIARHVILHAADRLRIYFEKREIPGALAYLRHTHSKLPFRLLNNIYNRYVIDQINVYLEHSTIRVY